MLEHTKTAHLGVYFVVMDSAKYFAQKLVAIFQIVAADLALQQIFEGELKRQKKRDTFATAFILTEHNFLNT